VTQSGRRSRRAREAGAEGKSAPAAPARPANPQVSVFVHHRTLTERAAAIDPCWMVAGSGAIVWLDLASPGPLTVQTGVSGLNVAFAQFMGGMRAQFLWILGVMLLIAGAMVWWVRRPDWI
jgi:hypothetical protein